MDKTRKIEICVAILFMALGSNTAMAVITADSTTWEGSYEGDDLPVDAGWMDLDGGGGNPITTLISGGGNSWIHTAAPNDGAYYRGYRWLQDPGAFDAQTNGGVTFEFRVKTYSKLMYFDVRTSSATDSRRLVVDVTTTNVTIKDNDDSGNAVTGNVNEGDWTTLRVTCDDLYWRVYRDGDPFVEAEVAVTGSRGVRPEERFDVYALYPDMGFELDYFRWTDAGAFVVPEPATMGLLALGGLMLRQRRR